MKENCSLFRTQDIACVIGDDSDHGSGLTQYSGLWTLVSRHFVHTAIAPPYAGLLAGTHRGTRPEFRRLDDSSARLFRAATGENALETEATFRLREPHHIDYEYNAVLKQRYKPGVLGDWLELSWCNYMNAVTDPAIYFLSKGEWVREYSTVHGYKAMFFPADLPKGDREHRPVQEYLNKGLPVPFHWTASETTFDLPLYYGRVHKMIYLLMFDTYLDLRFYISPTGGGGNSLGPGHHNPAWDWSFMIHQPEAGKQYSLKVRLVYKPFSSNQDVLEEYAKWEHCDRELLSRASPGR